MIEEENNNNCNDCSKISNCFSQLYPDELEFINNKKTQLNYLKGETIFKQGAFAPYVMFVIDGFVKTFLQTGYNKQINIGLAKAGDFLAFSSIFGENIYNHSAVTIKDSKICMIDKEALKTLLLKNPEFAMRITSRNYRNENHLFEIIKNISYRQMQGKLATVLLYLSSNDFIEEKVFQLLSRQDIADFASISTESAIKFLKEFEKEKILALRGKDIEIINKEKLEDISSRG